MNASASGKQSELCISALLSAKSLEKWRWVKDGEKVDRVGPPDDEGWSLPRWEALEDEEKDVEWQQLMNTVSV